MDKCGHYARWEEDFALVRESGLNALRYGPPYYRAHIAPNTYDWDVAKRRCSDCVSSRSPSSPIFCHFGVPSWLGGFQIPRSPCCSPSMHARSRGATRGSGTSRQ